LKLWNITNKKCEWTIQAHNGQIWSVEAAPDGASFFSVGNDKTIKRCQMHRDVFVSHSARPRTPPLPPFRPPPSQMHRDVFVSDSARPRTPPLPSLPTVLPPATLSYLAAFESAISSIITGITHHRHKNEFITCGERVLLWDSSTKAPKFSYDWSTSGDRNDASVVSVKFNPVETDLFASSDHANNIVLYDTRAKEVKKLKMTMRVNALAWNPMEAFILTAASEDYNLYSFDIRNMNKDNRVINIHEGHTSAVIDLDYAPTGREFCSGSYDRSLRIFRTDQGKSRDVYHTKRMFKVNCVLWSGDNKYILSGSSDHNVRVWKAVSHEKMGIMKSRERASVNYAEELKRKYGHFPEMRRILRHRHLPKHIYHARQEHRIMKDSLARKEDNRRRHSKRGAVPRVPARQKPVVGLQDDETSMPGPSFNDD
ncbi:DDB1- and CUL4-associated factor 13-like, partial [Homarus americanus]